jgi:hypothetical protein
MLTVSAHAETLDQVQSSIQDWLGDFSKGKDAPFSFSRTPHSSNRLCFIRRANCLRGLSPRQRNRQDGSNRESPIH